IDIKWRQLFFGDAFHYTSVMVRRSVMQEIGGYDENPSFQFAETYDPFSRIALRHRMMNIPQTLVLWRRHPDATSVLHAQHQGRACEAISFRNVCLLADQQIEAPVGPSPSKVYEFDVRYRDYIGLKAFISTPAGQFPVLPPEQVLSGLKFLCDVQQSFYRVHKFSRFEVARH